MPHGRKPCAAVDHAAAACHMPCSQSCRCCVCHMACPQARLPLAKMAVKETGMGLVEDKVIKVGWAGQLEMTKEQPCRRSALPCGRLVGLRCSLTMVRQQPTACGGALVSIPTRVVCLLRGGQPSATPPRPNPCPCPHSHLPAEPLCLGVCVQQVQGPEDVRRGGARPPGCVGLQLQWGIKPAVCLDWGRSLHAREQQSLFMAQLVAVPCSAAACVRPGVWWPFVGDCRPNDLLPGCAQAVWSRWRSPWASLPAWCPPR